MQIRLMWQIGQNFILKTSNSPFQIPQKRKGTIFRGRAIFIGEYGILKVNSPAQRQK